MRNTNDDVLFWLGLSCIPGVGRATFRKLVRRFGSPEKALHAAAEEIASVDGIPRKVVDAVRTFAWQPFAEQEREHAATAGVAIITADDAAYPAELREIPDAPVLLYARGELAAGNATCVAIVGTRTPTHHGRTVTRRIAADLAGAGITIVSGLARGIDTEAHRGALDANGRTIAVLGCGIDVAYPAENKTLLERISASGAVVTEYPFGTPPEAGRFPARNRIISGLSRGTVIVEATSDSGSLVTARYTQEQGRKLFALPGNAGAPTSRGTNDLIKQGTALVESAADIMAGLGVPAQPRVAGRPHRVPELSAEETAVFGTITTEPRHIDFLMQESRMTAATMSAVLMNLELKGLAKQLPGKYFVRCS